MFQARPFSLAAALLGAMLLCGCGHATPLAISPVAPAARPAPTVSVSVAPSTPSEGQVAVRFGAVSPFLTQTARAGIASIRVTLSGAALKTPVVEEATPDQIAADQGQMLFQGLPGGESSLLLEARNAQGAVLGQTTIQARIVDNRTIAVTAALALNAQ